MDLPDPRRRRLLGGLMALPLLAAACGSSSGSSSSNGVAAASGSSSSESMTGSTSESMSSSAMMPMQPGADAMKAAITSPSTGAMVTTNAVTLNVTTSGYEDTCALAGTPDQQGKGHYHILIDKSLVNMFCTAQATISMQNVKPGMHSLTVVPAQNDHAEVEANAQSITVDYEPTSPIPAITDASFAGAPSIKIVSPAPGTVVSGSFDVVVDVSNYNLSCDLFGKPDVAGYGHWHLNFDSDTGPMMGMGSMAGMSCQKLFHASTAGLKSGETHTLIALLVDNGHAPLHPDVNDKVEVTIG